MVDSACNTLDLDVPYEDLASLKRYLRSQYNTVVTHKYHQLHLTTAAYHEVIEDGAATIAFTAAAATLVAWQEGDVANDQGHVCTLVYWTTAGAEKTATCTLSNPSTAEVAFVPATADYYRTKKFTWAGDHVPGNKYIAYGLTGKGTLHGLIEEGQTSEMHTRHFTGPSTRRYFLADVRCSFPSASAACTIKINWTDANAVAREFIDNTVIMPEKTLNLCEELDPLTEVTFQVLKNADANHDSFNLSFVIIEAY
jgi:hypothetical protein